MFCVGICDDSQEARLHLRARLERVLEPHRDMDRVLEFSSGEGLLRWVENHPGELNLIFLDMEMGQLDGMETARRLRQIEESLPLVFVTGYTEHVFEGYTVGALGYLLKPVREDQLKEVLSRAAAALLREEEEVYLCRRGDVTYRIPRKKILYFTSDRRQVTCVTTEKHYTFYGKLDQVEEELKDSFVRIHQRYLVRTQAVQQISGSQVLVGGQTLPISRFCQQAAMIALTRASLEE